LSPVTHYLLGWLVANGNGFSRHERAAITLASVAPDLDSLGIVPEILTRNSAHPLHWYSDYHHLLGHNLAFGIVVAGATLLVAQRKLKTALFALITFHLHLLGDLLGARGPDGYQWPIPYWAPLTEAWQWSWNGQWALNAWPNFVITALALTATFYLAWKRGYSPLEMFSKKADAEFVKALRRRFGSDKAQGTNA
jgi:inner membrane protein